MRSSPYMNKSLCFSSHQASHCPITQTCVFAIVQMSVCVSDKVQSLPASLLKKATQITQWRSEALYSHHRLLTLAPEGGGSLIFTPLEQVMAVTEPNNLLNLLMLPSKRINSNSTCQLPSKELTENESGPRRSLSLRVQKNQESMAGFELAFPIPHLESRPRDRAKTEELPELNQKCKLYAKTAKCEQIEQTDCLSRTKLALYILPE